MRRPPSAVKTAARRTSKGPSSKNTCAVVCHVAETRRAEKRGRERVWGVRARRGVRHTRAGGTRLADDVTQQVQRARGDGLDQHRVAARGVGRIYQSR